MKLYNRIEYKNKDEIGGAIFNRPRKNEKEIYLRFYAEKTNGTYHLSLTTIEGNMEYHVIIREPVKMTAKNITSYVENLINGCWILRR